MCPIQMHCLGDWRASYLSTTNLTSASQLTVIRSVYFTFSPLDGECKPSKPEKTMTECESCILLGICGRYKACGKHSSKCTFCSISCGMAMAPLGQKETQVNFVLCPSATQFTELLQPAPQRIPHAPNKGKNFSCSSTRNFKEVIF